MKLSRLLLAALLLCVFVPGGSGGAQAANAMDDFVCETTTTAGTGTVDLAGALSGGYIGFIAAPNIASGDTVRYRITTGSGASRKIEVGSGVVTDATPDTLTRNATQTTDDQTAPIDELSLSGTSTVCLGWDRATVIGDKGDVTIGDGFQDIQLDAGVVGTTEAAALDAGDITTGTFADALVDGSLEVGEVLNSDLGDFTCSAGVCDLDATATIGAGAGVTWTFDAGATDPVFAFTSGELDITNTIVNLNDNLISTRTDTNHGLIHNTTVDGPELRGFAGFLFATGSAGATEVGRYSGNWQFKDDVEIDNAFDVRFLEGDGGGSNYKGFSAPATITSDTTCTFEDDANFIPDSCVGDGSDADTLGSDGDKGDVTVGGAGTTLAYDADSVTYADIQNVSADERVLGRVSGAGGDIEELTAAQTAQLMCGSDPNADRVYFWDDSAGGCGLLTLGNGFTISTTNVVVDSATQSVDGIVELATAAELQVGTDTARVGAVDQLWAANAIDSLTDAATITVDFSTFINASVTLAGNRTLGNPSNEKAGQTGAILVTASTSTRTLALSSEWLPANGTEAFPISITTTETVMITYWVQDSTHTWILGVFRRTT
jgi:hypothetical protein